MLKKRQVCGRNIFVVGGTSINLLDIIPNIIPVAYLSNRPSDVDVVLGQFISGLNVFVK